MTVQERNERVKTIRRRQVVKRRMILLLGAMFFIIVGSVVYGTIFSSAKNPTTDITQYKYYKSITIEKGDSLWSIAEEYNNSTDITTQEYIDELIQINRLTSETIHENQHLMIAYYDTELR